LRDVETVIADCHIKTHPNFLHQFDYFFFSPEHRRLPVQESGEVEMPAPTSLLLDAPKQLPMATAVCEANAACVCSNGSVIDAGYLSMSDRCGVVLLFYVVFLQSYVDDGVSQGRQATARHAKRNQELQRKLTNMLNTDRLYYAQQPVLCPALNHEIWQKQKKIFVLFSLRRPRWHCVGVWLRPSKH
jgi:hypothetical protein